MAFAPARSDCFARAVAISVLKPTPAMTGVFPFTSSTTVFTTSSCSAGVSEYSSPVPPAATTALMGCLSSARRFLLRPAQSSERSPLKGVTGKAITPRSLLRISSAFIHHHFHLAPAFVLSPSRENAPPVGIDMLAHLGCIVTLAILTFLITLAAAGKLIVVELNAEAGLVRNADGTIHDGHASAGNDF